MRLFSQGGGFIHVVRALGGGVVVQQKAYWLVLGELGRFNCKRMYAKNFFAGLLQNRNEVKCAIQIAKIIHSYLHRRVKKGKLDPRALLGILI